MGPSAGDRGTRPGRSELRDQGYPYAKVTVGEKPEPTSVVLTFRAEPGPLAHFGTIETVGNQTVENRVILRQLTFKTGDVYRRSLRQDSQRRSCAACSSFSSVNVETIQTEQQDPDDAHAGRGCRGQASAREPAVWVTAPKKAHRVDAGYHHVNFLAKVPGGACGGRFRRSIEASGWSSTSRMRSASHICSRPKASTADVHACVISRGRKGGAQRRGMRAASTCRGRHRF